MQLRAFKWGASSRSGRSACVCFLSLILIVAKTPYPYSSHIPSSREELVAFRYVVQLSLPTSLLSVESCCTTKSQNRNPSRPVPPKIPPLLLVSYPPSVILLLYHPIATHSPTGSFFPVPLSRIIVTQEGRAQVVGTAVRVTRKYLILIDKLVTSTIL